MAADDRSEATIALRRYQLTRFARWCECEPGEVTPDQVVGWLTHRPWGGETRRSARAALREFYRWAVEVGIAERDPSAGIRGIRPPDPAPRPVEEETLEQVLERCSPRVRVMVRLASELGLRRGEVARVRMEHLRRGRGGWVLEVDGKGGRPRVLPITDDLARAVRVHAMATGVGRSGWVFPGDDGGHLSPAWIGKLVSRELPTGEAMHALRHRFATAAYDVDTDLLAVQRLLGHASAETTQRYILRTEDTLRATVMAVGR